MVGRILIVVALAASVLTAAAAPAAARTVAFTLGELLGKPTSGSVTINFRPAETINVHVEYGTSPGSSAGSTTPMTAGSGSPSEITISGLNANTRYYYRLVYETSDDLGNFATRPEHSFWTQRAPGSTFSFVLQSDSHIEGGPTTSTTVYNSTIANMVADSPDFLIDVGDMFEVTGSAANANSYYAEQRGFLAPLSGDAAVFLTIGNHENEEGWWRTGSGNNGNPQTPIWSINGRKNYFANPVPNGFYTGDTQNNSGLGVTGDGLRETYYSWTWGDALFVVLDPFWNTTTRPHGNGNGSDPGTDQGDNWSWTLGQTQYNWLYNTVSNSNAAYKFVFTHHLTGGSADGYGRGGEDAVTAGYEWGATGAATPDAQDFATNRPGWTHGSVHSFLVANDVSAVFHGHDHCYADEIVNGIVYQEVAMPNAGSASAFCGGYVNTVSNSGHTRVTVSPSQTTVNYVQSTGSVADTYTIAPSSGGPSLQPPTANAGPDQGVTDTNSSGSETVTLDGRASSDIDGSITGYLWSEGGAQIATGSNPDVELAVGTHNVTLQVTDDDSLTDTDTVTITVNPAPIAPTADAGPDQTVIDTNGNGTESVTLDGSASIDPDGTITAYRWTEGATQIATGANPLVSLGVGTHVITLRVTDNDGLTATDTVTITVNALPPPSTTGPPPPPPGPGSGSPEPEPSGPESSGGAPAVECPTASTPFGDVAPGSFAYADIACIYGLGLTNGTSDTTYSPAGLVTREQMAAFLARVARLLGATDPTGSHPFVDVAANSFARNDIALIYALGVTQGTSPTTFSPHEYVTREQMAAFLARLYSVLLGSPTEPVKAVVASTPFGDVSASSFAAEDIGRIYGLHITTGTTVTTYSPDAHVTREQMAAFLARLVRVLNFA